MSMPVIQPGTITRDESVADIISSIAAEESAIDHILNAESEKLHRLPSVTQPPQPTSCWQLTAPSKTQWILSSVWKWHSKQSSRYSHL